MTSAVTDMIAPADVQEQAASATRDALAFVEANKVDVVDLVTLQQAVQVRAAIGERQKTIIAQLSKPKAWAYSLHRWFCSLEAAALEPYAQLDGYESAQISAFKAAEDARRQQQERVDAEARRQEEQTRAAAEAAALERAGEHDMAAAVLEESITAPPPIIALPDATRGIAKFRKEWKWRYTTTELRALELLPRAYLTVDERKLTAYAKAHKSAAKLPGIQVFSVDVPVR